MGSQQEKILYLVALKKVSLKAKTIGLTEWEQNFWRGNRDALKKGEPLSKAQWAVLGRMESRAISYCNYAMTPTPEIKFKQSAIDKYKWQIGMPWVRDRQKMPEPVPTTGPPDPEMDHLDGIEADHGQ